MENNTTTIHQFKQGDTFADGRYILQELLGVGGFADVYKAYDNLTKVEIALKIYTNLNNEDIENLSMEYAQMLNLNNDYILKANYFGRWGNIPFVMMPYCRGGSLDRKIGKLNESQITKMVEDVGKGLAYLHRHHIVHQDIKPANILIHLNENEQPEYKLSDFGISNKTKTQLSKSIHLAQSSLSLTVAYAPPEKFSAKRADREPDPLGDIFSFGLTIYELLTETLPYGEISTGNQMYQFPNTTIDLSEIPYPRLRWITDMCVQRDKQNRPTAIRILEMLNADNAEIPTQYFDPEVVAETESIPKPTPNFESTPESTPDSECNSESDTQRETIVLADELQNDPRPNRTIQVDKRRILSRKAVAICSSSILVVGIAIWMILGGILKSSETTTKFEPIITTQKVAGVEFEMSEIPGGEMIIGYDDMVGDSTDMKRITIKPFLLATTEVTQNLWKAVMGTNPSLQQGDSLPVNNISYNDCLQFIARLNAITGKKFRLPTEWEWEFAAKMQPNIKYRSFPNNPIMWSKENSDGRIQIVKSSDSPNEFGLYDMGGNVIEWTSSIYNGTNAKEKNEISLRGGYFDSELNQLRSTSRGSAPKGAKSVAFGMRLAL